MAADWRDEHPELARTIREFEVDIQKLSDGFESGVRGLDAGEHEDVATVIGLTHYALGRLEENRRRILRELKEAGIDPPREGGA